MSDMSEAEIANQYLVRRTLEAAHREYNQGILENQPADILAFYEKWTAPNFVERDNPKGHVTKREEMLGVLEQVVTSGSLGDFGAVLEANSTITELVSEGNSAVAVIAHKHRYLQIDTQGWYGVSSEENEIEASGRWRETWVKTDEGWRFLINQMLTNEIYVDGVLFSLKPSG